MDIREQRRDVRVSFQAPLVVKWRSEERSGSGTVSNMSQSGCYILTQNPALPLEQIFIKVGEALPEIECLVRYVDQQVGMGVQFVGVKLETEKALADLLKAKAVVWAQKTT